MGRLDDGAERLDSRAVIGEAVAALGSRGERTAEQVLAEYLRGLHRGKRVAGDIGGDIAILDALDAVLDRNDRRGSAALGGGGNRLSDNGLGDERAGAVVYGNELPAFSGAAVMPARTDSVRVSPPRVTVHSLSMEKAFASSV